MMQLVQNKVYYKIFDRSNKPSSYIYGKYRTNNITKLAEIEQNADSVVSECQANQLLVLHQVHGDTIADADCITDFKLEPQADSAITTKKNIILSVQTADCVPVLISSYEGEIIGAAHCGWKGVKLSIIEKVIRAMKNKGAQKMAAVIGPSIQQNSYEVDQLFYENFTNTYEQSKGFFKASKTHTHYMFNLPGFVEYALKEEGVNIAHRVMDDTYTNPDKYPSYRRSCHLGTSEKTESILSIIMIKG